MISLSFSMISEYFLWRGSDFLRSFYTMPVCRTSGGGRKLPKLLAISMAHAGL